MKVSLQSTPASFSDYLNCLAGHGERMALATADGRQQFTYSQLVTLINHNASTLASQIKPGDRVLFIGLEGPAWVVSFFAVLLVGGVIVPIDHRMSQAVARNVCHLTTPSRVITLAKKHFLDVPHIQPSLDVTASTAFTPVATMPDHPAEIVLTSGTWSEPKGVILTHGNLLSNLSQVLQVYRPKPSERGLSILPLSHTYEQMGGLLVPLVCGCSLVYQQQLDRASLIQAMQCHRPTTMVVVPRLLEIFYQAIIQEAKLANRENHLRFMLQRAQKAPTTLRRKIFFTIHRQFGGRLRTLIVGGAPLAPEVDAFFQNLGFRVVTGYGLTEASPAVSMRLASQSDNSSVGQLLPRIQARLADDGELLLRGPNISTHYVGQPTASEWLSTGDIADIRPDGELFITGRKKNLVVYPTGDKIQLEDIERLVELHPAVIECAAVCLCHDAKPIIILLYRGENIASNDIVQIVNAQLPFFARVDHAIKVTEHLPRSHTLKLNRTDLQLYAERLLNKLPDSDRLPVR